MTKDDIPALKAFTDMAIGDGYYSLDELAEIYRKSLAGTDMCTLVMEVDGNILGVRITYPPGNWSSGKGSGLNPSKWPHAFEQTAYFQSLFVHPSITGQGAGRRMSLEAIKVLKRVGAKGIVCHSWKESPNNSSNRYLLGLGFKSIAEHPLYWNKVDYFCTRCGKPCVCTAEEMYLDLQVL